MRRSGVVWAAVVATNAPRDAELWKSCDPSSLEWHLGMSIYGRATIPTLS